MLCKISKDSVIAFLLGVIVGIFMTFVFLGGMYAMYKVGKKISSSARVQSTAPHLISKKRKRGKGFKISFENEKEMKFFKLADGLYAEKATQYATDGKYSLMAEYPQGANAPGLSWEVYGESHCMDWSGADVFCFNVYNANDFPVELIVRIKSNPNYPKPTYEEKIMLSPQGGYFVEISISELQRRGLNPKCISYLKLYLYRPQRDAILYFDNLHLERKRAYFPLIPKAEAASSDYKITVENTLRKIFLNESKFKERREVNLLSAKNEYEGFQIILFNSKKDLTDVVIQVSDLINEETGERISKENIKCYTVGYIRTRKPYYSVKFVGLWPDPLIPGEKFELKKGRNRVIWIEIYVPENASSGIYKGKVAIIPQNASLQEIEVSLKVWDFSLPRRSHLKTAFDFYPQKLRVVYTRKKGESYLQWKERVKQLEEKYYLDMLKHRISPIFNIDPLSSAFEERIERYLKEGLTCFGIGKYSGTYGNNWPKDKEELEALIPLYKKYAEVLAEKNLLGMAYIYTWDEGDIGNPWVREVTEIIHKADSRLKNMVCYHGFWNPDKDSYWGKDIDIWCFQIAHYDKRLREKLERLGKEIWMYVSGPRNLYPNLAVDFPAVEPRIIPWMCWKYKIKGFLYWCVNFWSDDPWKEAMNTPWHQNGNGYLYYPGENGPVASIRLKVLRDGLEDYEYFYLLKYYLSVLKKKKDLEKKYQNLVKESERLLRIDDSIVASFNKFTQNPKKIYMWREKVAQMIEKLRRVL